MNIKQETDYAIRAVLILAKWGMENKLDAKTISEKGNVPLRFLLKLLGKLSQANIIKSYRGVNGGYELSREARDITLKDVVEAIEGPIAINRCIYDKEACNANKIGYCAIHKAMCNIQNTLIRELEKVNFEDLKNEPW
ncbi:MAG: Rrf2 family transcriptional regulator [Bacillota bacterium]|nr:Rrf2 family transcriptional regulator [Bacillota bacterium]